MNFQTLCLAGRRASVALIIVAALGLAACGEISSNQSSTLASTSPTGSTGTVPSSASSTSETLSWAPPQSNEDGSYLVNLAGYKILYGTDADNLDQTIVIDNPSINIYVVDNLAPGTWHFAIVSVNQSGMESSLSPVVSTTIG